MSAKIRLLIALALAVAFSLPTLAATPATGNSTAVRGVVTSASGKPTRSTVVLFALRFTAKGAQLVEVSRQRTGNNGRFGLSGRLPQNFEQAAKRNSGYAHLMLGAVTKTHQTVHFFSKKLTSGGNLATAETSSTPVKLKANKRLSAKEKRLEAQLRPSGASAALINFFSCSFSRVETASRYTAVGYLPSIRSTESTFTYGEDNTADSQIQIKVKHGDDWSAGGSVHIGNKDGAEVSVTQKGEFSWVMGSMFRYDRLKKPGFSLSPGCLFAPDEIITPRNWVGGMVALKRAGGHHRCDKAPFRDHATTYMSGSTLTRVTNRFLKFEVGVTVFGVGLSTQSGASRQVKLKIQFNNSDVACGKKDFPLQAKRILLGI